MADYIGFNGTVDEDAWATYHVTMGDGIVNDYSGVTSAFNISRSSTDRTITLSTSADYRVKGILFHPTETTTTLVLPSIAAGSTRYDRIVARLDMTARTVTFQIRSGAPAAAGATPSRPGLVRSSTIWESGLWTLLGGNTAASGTTAMDERIWIGTHGTYPTARNGLYQTLPRGSTLVMTDTGETWRMDARDGGLYWTNIDDPAWTDLTLPTGATNGMTAYDQPPQCRVKRGVVELRGSIKRTSGNLTDASGGSGVLLTTLTPTFKPAVQQRFPVAPYGYVLINTSGQVTFADRAANAFVNLDGIRFTQA